MTTYKFFVLFLIFIIKTIYCEQIVFKDKDINKNNDNLDSVYKASCGIFKNQLNYIIAPCAKSKKVKNQLNKIQNNNFNDELVSDEPYEIINNKYAYEAMLYGGAESCINEDTEFECTATGDRLRFESQLTCRSENPCEFSLTSSSSVSLTSGSNSGSGISFGSIDFNKGSSNGFSSDSGISQVIGTTVPAGRTVRFYTFYLMKKCSFVCKNENYSLLTYEGNKKGTLEDRILLWLVDLNEDEKYDFLQFNFKQSPECEKIKNEARVEHNNMVDAQIAINRKNTEIQKVKNDPKLTPSQKSQKISQLKSLQDIYRRAEKKAASKYQSLHGQCISKGCSGCP